MSLVRPIALCLLEHEGRLLLHDFVYHGVRYLRPPGGGIDFGEYAVTAVRREIMEEIGGTISTPELLAVLENPHKFIEHQEPKHEIVFLFIAALLDTHLCAQEVVEMDDNGLKAEARWHRIDQVLRENAPWRLEPAPMREVLLQRFG